MALIARNRSWLIDSPVAASWVADIRRPAITALAPYLFLAVEPRWADEHIEIQSKVN